MKRRREKPFARGATFTGRQSLYAREQELLLVDGYYVERYRRFPYEDIQAVLWRKDSTFTALTLGVSILLGLCGLIAFLNGAMGGLIAFLFLSAVPTLSLIIYAVQGGKIIAYIVTPAQQTRLTFVKTRRKLDKLFTLLTEKGVVPEPHGPAGL